MTKYTYSIQNDFPNHIVSSNRLSLEIRSGVITIALDYIGTSGDDCDIFFKADLPTEDKTVLDGLVSIHSGEELPSEAQSVLIDQSQTPIPVSVIANSGYSPDPTSYPDGTLPSAIDADNNQQIRGQILTDEGCFRDDFAGDSLETLLTGTVTFTNGSTTVTGIGTNFRTELDTYNYVWSSSDESDKAELVSKIISNTQLELDDVYDGYTTTTTTTAKKSYWVSTKTADGYISVSDSKVHLHILTCGECSTSLIRYLDYQPLKVSSLIRISQRIENQMSSFGFLDQLGNFQDVATVMFTGTDDTKIKFITGCQGTMEETIISLPAGAKTNSEQLYEIELRAFIATLVINGKPVVSHKRHIPRPYKCLLFGVGIWNMGTTISETVISIENVYISNHNLTQISGSFLTGEPLSVRLSEDCHSITGIKTTTSTDEDQIILQFIVPTDKVMYTTGYSISAPDNSVSGYIKIGRGDLTVEPVAPGIIDSGFLRIFKLSSDKREYEDWSASPRLLGVSGDIIKLTVTPNGSLSSDWCATIDYILR
jgi:hypothetical protein